MQFYADALNESTLNISGNAGKSVALTADGTAYTAKNESADTKGADSTYTRGFHLAGVDIPYPTGDYVQKTGTTSLSDTAALCWVQRCTTEGKVAWVLSLVNGSCPAKKDISCGGSTGNEGETSYAWEKGTLSQCKFPKGTYCTTLRDQGSAGVLAMCNAVASYSDCGTPSKGSVCRVKEQHTTPPGCTSNAADYTSTTTITVFEVRLYNAVAKPSPFL